MAQSHGGNGFALVELFTSEGCSSCPPADKLVAQLRKDNDGKNVFVLGYHVDYWDKLGWKDAFSNEAWTERQYNYAKQLKLESVYTPEVIVNGRQEMIGSDARKMRSAIAEALAKQPAATLTLQEASTSAGNSGTTRETISYTIESNAAELNSVGGLKNKVLLIALVQKTASSDVRAGENAGRKIDHINVVLALKKVALKGRTKGQEILEIPADLHRVEYSVTAFIQDQEDGSIIAAASL
jgi:hypothetical protein